MDQIRYPVLTEKTIRLLERNQYSFDAEIGTNKPEMKKCIETFFAVKIIGINSHRLPRKNKRIGAMGGYVTHYKRIIVKLEAGYSIPLFSKE